VVGDITARKQAEEALRESELELRRVLGAASDYFWSGDIDSEGRSATGTITGSRADYRSVGRVYMAGSERWMSTVHPEDRARLSEISERLLSGQSSPANMNIALSCLTGQSGGSAQTRLCHHQQMAIAAWTVW